MDVVTDPWFIENVGTIFTEVGSVDMAGRINEFLRGAQTDSLENRREVTAIFATRRTLTIGTVTAGHGC